MGTLESWKEDKRHIQLYEQYLKEGKPNWYGGTSPDFRIKWLQEEIIRLRDKYESDNTNVMG